MKNSALARNANQSGLLRFPFIIAFCALPSLLMLMMSLSFCRTGAGPVREFGWSFDYLER